MLKLLLAFVYWFTRLYGIPFLSDVIRLLKRSHKKNRGNEILLPHIRTSMNESRKVSYQVLLEKFLGIKRSVTIIRTLDGESLTCEAEGFYARVIQHECDHLDGKMYIERSGISQNLDAMPKNENI